MCISKGGKAICVRAALVLAMCMMTGVWTKGYCNNAQCETEQGSILAVHDSLSRHSSQEAKLMKLMDNYGRFRLYPTFSSRIWLKLDTHTGRLWALRLDNPNRSAPKLVVVNDKDLGAGAEYFDGRFVISDMEYYYYMYMFDKATGGIYQIYVPYKSENIQFRALEEDVFGTGWNF